MRSRSDQAGPQDLTAPWRVCKILGELRNCSRKAFSLKVDEALLLPGSRRREILGVDASAAFRTVSFGDSRLCDGTSGEILGVS